MEKVIIDNKSVAVADTKVKFGLKAITLPTPKVATQIFRAVLYAATVVTILTNTFTEIPPELKATINKYALEVVTAVHLISKLFGLEEKK